LGHNWRGVSKKDGNNYRALLLVNNIHRGKWDVKGMCQEKKKSGISKNKEFLEWEEGPIHRRVGKVTCQHGIHICLSHHGRGESTWERKVQRDQNCTD